MNLFQRRHPSGIFCRGDPVPTSPTASLIN